MVVHSSLFSSLKAPLALMFTNVTDAPRGKRHSDLPRGTRGEALWLPAFEVAHLAAAGGKIKLNSFAHSFMAPAIMEHEISAIIAALID